MEDSTDPHVMKQMEYIVDLSKGFIGSLVVQRFILNLNGVFSRIGALFIDGLRLDLDIIIVVVDGRGECNLGL